MSRFWRFFWLNGFHKAAQEPSAPRRTNPSEKPEIATGGRDLPAGGGISSIPGKESEPDMSNQSYIDKILLLERDLLSSSAGSIGALYDRDEFVCHILEDTHRIIPLKGGRENEADVLEDVKKKKIYGHTRIPAGLYQVVIKHDRGRAHKEDARYASDPNFTHDGIFELADVPGFSYIQFHPGNYPSDTLGCLLPGKWGGRSMSVSASRVTYKMFYSRYREIADAGRLWIKIVDGA